MRRRYEPERHSAGREPWSVSRERHQDDRDAYGEYPGQYGGDYDDAERRFARSSYEHAERDTGTGGERGSESRGHGERSYGQGGRDWERSNAARPGYGGRDYGEPDYAGQGYGARDYSSLRGGSSGQGYGGQGGQRYVGYGGRDDAQSYGGSGDRDYGQGYRGGGPSSGGRSSNESSQGFRGRGPKGYSRSDERIREEVCERLSGEDIDVGEVEVQVTSGEVTLSGTVSDRRTKRETESIAESVSGVKDVSNQIRVRSETEKKEGSQNAFGNRHSIGENDKQAH